MKKIIFVSKKRIDQYGISYGLVNSSNFVANALIENSPDIYAKTVVVNDGNGIDKEIHNNRPTHVIINAIWVSPQKIKELLTKWKAVEFIIRIHSKIPFLANEGIAFKWIKEYRDVWQEFNNFYISGNSEIFSDDMSQCLGFPIEYLPNIYYPNIPTSYKYKIKFPKTINIGCFGSLRPLKNHLNQAVACVKFAEKHDLNLNFHINGTRVEQNGEQVSKNLINFFECTNHKLISHEWLNHLDFIDLIRQMDLGIQVSFSESFNIVAADFVEQGIPMVMSKDIDWSPKLFAADPNETSDIISKLESAWFGRLLFLQKLNKLNLNKYNKTSIEIWKNFIYKLF